MVNSFNNQNVPSYTMSNNAASFQLRVQSLLYWTAIEAPFASLEMHW
jgi:hypothetical protein